MNRGDAKVAGGVQGGYNWQSNSNWVAGFEGDIGAFRTNRSFLNFNDSSAFGIQTDWYATVRGRLGYTSGPSLFYATGGAAFVKLKNNFDNDFMGDNFAAGSRVAAGWTVGGGIETMLGGNWSTKAEYLYIDAGSQDVFNAFQHEHMRFDNRFHLFRYGVNYRIGELHIAGPASMPA